MNTPIPQSNLNLATLLEDIPDEERAEATTAWSSLDRVEEASDLSSEDRRELFERIEATLSVSVEYGLADSHENMVAVSAVGELETTRIEGSNEMMRPKLGRRLSSHRFWRASVAAVLVLAIGTLLVSSTQRIYVPAGDRAQVTLPDGSQVTLNSDSELSWSRGFLRGRKVELRGEGFFAVVSRKDIFTVTTPDAEVRVLGTKFNVRSRADLAGKGSVVTVLEGRVEFRSRTERRGIELAAGQQSLLLTGAIRPRSASTVAEGAYLEWMTGDLIFRDLPLEEAIAEAGRQLGVKITLHASEAAAIGISAAFRSPLSTELILDGLTIPLGLQYRSTVEGYEVFNPGAQTSKQ